MDYKIVQPEDFVVTEWSGGNTTQFFIYPEGSSLAKRDFDWRISSASFTGSSSQFSDFSGYQRYILALQGELFVDHENLYKRTLFPYDVEYFYGKWTTKSNNSLDCIDFNFIVKEDLHANLAILKEDDLYAPKRKGKLILYSKESCIIQISETQESTMNLDAENLLIIDEDDILNCIKVIQSDSPVVICEVN